MSGSQRYSMPESNFPTLSRAMDWLMSLKHPILFLLVIGVLVRLVVMASSMVYDLDYWAVVIRNIEAGNGLYEAEGYYYTPVWGYILGLMSSIQEYVLCLGEIAVRVIEAFPVEYIPDTYYTATAPSLAFIYSVKIPLMFFDIVMAFLSMAIVRDYTSDDRKSVLAFALTFLCPVLFLSSAMIGMPDTIAVVFALMTVLLVRKNHPFFAGMTFSLAVLTKFFPAFFIFVLVVYLLMRNRNSRSEGLHQITMAVLGAALMTLLIFLPQILEGNLESCFRFLTDRVNASGGGSLFLTIANTSRVLVYVVVLVLSVVIAIMMYRRRDRDPYAQLVGACFLIATLCLIYPPTTQYMVIVVPFLAIWAASRDSRYVYSWIIMAIGSLIYVYATNALTLMPLAAWTDMLSIDTVMDIFNWSNTTMVGPVSLRSLQFIVGGVLQCIGVVSVLFFMFEDKIRRIIRREREFLSSDSSEGWE